MFAGFLSRVHERQAEISGDHAGSSQITPAPSRRLA
jgi:hypothetical protein